MKKLAQLGGIVLLVGIILVTVLVVKNGFDFEKLKNDKELIDMTYVTKEINNELEITEHEGQVIVRRGDVSNITINYKNDSGKERYNITEYNGKLKMYAIEKNGLFNFNFFNVFKNYKIEVIVPETFNGILFVHTNTGKIQIDDMNVSKLDVKNNTGSIIINNTVVKTISEIKNNTGSIKLDKLITNILNVENDTGSIKINNVVSQNKISAENDTGSIKIENIVSDDIELKNDTGSIKGTIKGNENEYLINSKSDLGSNNLYNSKYGEKKLKVKTDTGSINIEFVE